MKIKGAIKIHVKFSGARKLKILRYFRILHVQILSGFKNWDIQDLTLRRCDTLKVVDEISLNFAELFVVHYSNITKIEQKRLLLSTFLVSFFMAFLAQNRFTQQIYS